MPVEGSHRFRGGDGLIRGYRLILSRGGRAESNGPGPDVVLVRGPLVAFVDRDSGYGGGCGANDGEVGRRNSHDSPRPRNMV